MWRVVFIVCLLYALCMAKDGCDQEESRTLYCQGSRAVRNALRNLNKSDKPIVILRGLEIVPLKNQTERIIEKNNDDNLPILDSLSLYLRTHEVNLKLSELLADDDAMKDRIGETEARKKDKGQGMLLAMALMFGKMMAVMGLGGIGALAFKALGVAMMALTMAAMLGLKSAAHSGHESSHSISYLTSEGHPHKRRRRRRSAINSGNHQNQVLIAEEKQQRPLAMEMAYKGYQ